MELSIACNAATKQWVQPSVFGLYCDAPTAQCDIDRLIRCSARQEYSIAVETCISGLGKSGQSSSFAQLPKARPASTVEFTVPPVKMNDRRTVD